MRELKVGDKVRRVNRDLPYGDRVLTVSWLSAGGELIRIREFGSYTSSVNPYWELIEEEEEMKLADLKAGMRVETRNGEQAVMFARKGGDLRLLFQTEVVVGRHSLSGVAGEYTSDMKYHCRKEGRYMPPLDIMKVWSSANTGGSVCDLSEEMPKGPIWVRKEKKELTVAEIEKLLGYEVKIVK